MPYIPKINPFYQCEGCGGWFQPSGIDCLVAHPPGSCCHENEVLIQTETRGRDVFIVEAQ